MNTDKIPLNINLEPVVTIPVEVDNFNKDVITAAAKASLIKSNYHCPDCGEPLYVHHREEYRVVLYCLECDKKVNIRIMED